MIDRAAQKFAAQKDAADVDTAGVYFPDAVIEAFAARNQPFAASIFRAYAQRPDDLALLQQPLIRTPVIPLEKSKALILDALAGFDPALAETARKLLGTPGFLQVREAPCEEVRTMQCRPAACTSQGMENDKPHPVVDIDYDNTIRAAVILGHEIGHAIADEYQRASGHSYRDNPAHMIETQAYLVQNILYAHLKTQPDKDIADAAARFEAAEMARNICDMTLSLAAMDALQAADAGKAVNPAAIFTKRFGAEWEDFTASYAPAQRVFDAMAVLKIDAGDAPDPAARKTLHDEYQRLHGRPTSLLSAAGMAAHLAKAPGEIRREVSTALLGGHGPKSMSDVLGSAGIGTPKSLQDFADKTLQAATGYFAAPGAVDERPAGPPQRHGNRQQTL